MGLVCDDVRQCIVVDEWTDGAYIVDGDRIGREVVGLVRRDEHTNMQSE